MYSGTVSEKELKLLELRKRVPDVTWEELLVGPETIEALPCERPWMTCMGNGLIGITDIRRREDGRIEVQLADENGVPYNNGTEWRLTDHPAFWESWPK